MMKKRRLFVSILAALLALLMIAPMLVSIFTAVTANAASQAEIDSLKEKQAGIVEQRQAIKAQINDLETQQATALEVKAALDRQNELTRQEIENINEQIAAYERLIELKAIELDEAIAAEKLQYERYRTRVRAMEENGELNYISILFKATNFSDLLSRIDDISEIMDYDAKLEQKLQDARAHLETVKAEYEATLAEYEVTKQDLLDRKAQLEREIETAYQLILEIESDLEKNKQELEANEAAEAQVQADIYTMVAELQRQEEEAKKAAEAVGATWQGGAAAVGATGSYIWPLPSDYTVHSPFGNRIHPIFGTQRFHAGVDIGGPSGAAIVASDSGSVITSTFSSSYGNYVVINHGGGNTTLYAHMSSTAVSVGASVAQGDTIGYVGSTGWSTGPHLHFEVRVNNGNVDPLQYFSGYSARW